MSMRRLLHGILFLAVFAMAFRVSIFPDSWWHLRAGQYIVEEKELLTWDPFSYTRFGEPWRYPGGIVQAAMYLVYDALGPGGMSLWTAVIVSLSFWFIHQSMPKTRVFSNAVLVLLASVASAVFWTARPFLITFLLTSVFMWILDGYRKKQRDHVWWMPLLMLLWANSHGGFIVGFFLWGAYFLDMSIAWVRSNQIGEEVAPIKSIPRRWLGDLIKGAHGKLGLIGMLMLIVVPINPAGPIIYLYFFATFNVDAAWDLIAEWQSPNFHEPAILPFLILVLISLLLFGASRRRTPISHLIITALFLYMALLSGRNIALFALVMPVILAPHCDQMIRYLKREWALPAAMFSDRTPTGIRRIVNYLIFILALVGSGAKVATVFPSQTQQALFRQLYPVDAVSFIVNRGLEGRMMNSYSWGGYLQMHLPQYPVYIDGRADLYGNELIEEWLDFVSGAGNWQAILDKWEVNFIVVESHWPVISLLENAGWEQIYVDEIAVVYQR